MRVAVRFEAILGVIERRKVGGKWRVKDDSSTRTLDNGSGIAGPSWIRGIGGGKRRAKKVLFEKGEGDAEERSGNVKKTRREATRSEGEGDKMAMKRTN